MLLDLSQKHKNHIIRYENENQMVCYDIEWYGMRFQSMVLD